MRGGNDGKYSRCVIPAQAGIQNSFDQDTISNMELPIGIREAPVGASSPSSVADRSFQHLRDGRWETSWVAIMGESCYCGGRAARDSS
jgi:hypothetical protein